MEVNFTFFALIAFSLVVFTLMFYVPGSVLLRFFFPKLRGSASVSFGVGISAWALASYFLTYLGLRPLLWFYLGFFGLYYLKTKPRIPNFIGIIKQNKLLLLLVGIGVLFQTLSVAPSGIKGKDGIRFYQVNGYDGIYYLALDKNLLSTFPPDEPGFSGKRLINYHYFSNLVTADVSRMFKLPIIQLHFQTFPLALSIILGLLVYQVGLGLTKTKLGGYASVFLVYFGSDLGYLISLVLMGEPSISNLQAIDRSTLLFVNPPRAFAYIVLLSGILLLFQVVKTKKMSQLFFVAMVLATSVGFKIYVGMFAVAVMTIYTIWLSYRKLSLKPFAVMGAMAAVGSAIFFPNNSSSGGLFWAPFNWPRHYFASTYLQKVGWHLQEQEFLQHGNTPRIVLLYFKYTIVFLLATFGTRIVGLFAFWPNRKKISINLIAILVPTAIFIAVGLLFLQENGIFETFNFFSVAALGASFLTAYILSKLYLQKPLTGILVTVLILLMTLPRPLYDARDQIKAVYSKGGSYTLISSKELLALDYIKENAPSSSAVLVAPGNLIDSQTPYVELFSERKTYFSGFSILTAHGQNINDRQKLVDEIFSGKTKQQLFSKMKINGLDLLYIKLPRPEAVDFNYSQSEIFYENQEVLVVKPI